MSLEDQQILVKSTNEAVYFERVRWAVTATPTAPTKIGSQNKGWTIATSPSPSANESANAVTPMPEAATKETSLGPAL